MNDRPVAEMSFEEAMKALEEVVTHLEKGDVPLEDSIALYERGAALKARCDECLKRAQEKVDQIRLGEDGAPAGTAPFDAG